MFRSVLIQYKKYSRVLQGSLLPLIILLVSQGASAWATAAPLVDVTDRVNVSLSKTEKKHKTYIVKATLRNTSLANIDSPVQLVVNKINKNNLSIINASGLSNNALPYVATSLSKGVLRPGESTIIELRFVKSAKNDDDDDDRDDDRDDDDDDKKGGHSRSLISHTVLGGASIAPQQPNSLPYALSPKTGNVSVIFSIGVLREGAGNVGVINLKNIATGQVTLTNDNGADGDINAADNIYSATVNINTNELIDGQCLPYIGTAVVDGVEVKSSVYYLCATLFPTRVALSNNTPGNIITVRDSGIVLADEVLVQFEQGISKTQIDRIVNNIQGRVVGTVLPVNLYQVKLRSPLSPDRMRRLINQLRETNLIVTAAANGIVSNAATPNDPQFPTQNGLRALNIDDGWDTNARGNGIIVTLLDSGVNAAHPDFSPSQITAGGANTDSTGHGTQMAGIIASVTDNGTGVAGIAYNSQIQSIAVNLSTDALMIQGYNDVAAFGVGQIVNASINRISPAFSVPNLCLSINNAINSGTGKVLINSAGNQSDGGNFWPGRCNDAAYDAFRAAGDLIVNKARFIVVSASNCNASECPSDSLLATSNSGPWVDAAAPGVNVPTTQNGGAYTTISGTSPAAAIVSGVSANLLSCGVTINNLETALRAGTLVQVPYPAKATFHAAGNTPRVDMLAGLSTLNTAPTNLNISNSTINENTNTAGGFTVGTLTTVDSTVCDRFSYAITGGADAGSFSLTGANNSILRITAGVLNFEAKSSYSVTVSSTDYFGLSTSRTFTINIIDLDEAPSIGNQTRNVNENASNGTLVGAAITSSDPDAGYAPSYAITGGNTGGAFAINSGSGQITVANTAALNYEATPSFSLTVQVTDTNDAPPLSSSATVTINVNDINESPIITSIAPTTGTVGDLYQYQIVVVDPDDANNGVDIGFLLSGAPAGMSVSATGLITWTPGVGVTTSGAVTVTVSDGGEDGSVPAVQVFTITVTSTNTTPIISNQTLSINENSPIPTVVGTVIASDPGDTLVYSIISGSSAFSINSTTGQISLTGFTVLDFETTVPYALTVRVTDSGSLSNQATVTIQINNIAEGPTSLPNPILALVTPVPYETYTGSDSNLYDRYRIEVVNRTGYPIALFEAAPSLPPCGLNTSAARSWVYIYNGISSAYIYGFCALGTSEYLSDIWFAMPTGVTPPASIYITITDRLTTNVFTSNTITIP